MEKRKDLRFFPSSCLRRTPGMTTSVFPWNQGLDNQSSPVTIQIFGTHITKNTAFVVAINLNTSYGTGHLIAPCKEGARTGLRYVCWSKHLCPKVPRTMPVTASPGARTFSCCFTTEHFHDNIIRESQSMAW